jgi:hypothetical protein
VRTKDGHGFRAKQQTSHASRATAHRPCVPCYPAISKLTSPTPRKIQHHCSAIGIGVGDLEATRKRHHQTVNRHTAPIDHVAPCVFLGVPRAISASRAASGSPPKKVLRPRKWRTHSDRNDCIVMARRRLSKVKQRVLSQDRKRSKEHSIAARWLRHFLPVGVEQGRHLSSIDHRICVREASVSHQSSFFSIPQNTVTSGRGVQQLDVGARRPR